MGDASVRELPLGLDPGLDRERRRWIETAVEADLDEASVEEGASTHLIARHDLRLIELDRSGSRRAVSTVDLVGADVERRRAVRIRRLRRIVERPARDDVGIAGNFALVFRLERVIAVVIDERATDEAQCADETERHQRNQNHQRSAHFCPPLVWAFRFYRSTTPGKHPRRTDIRSDTGQYHSTLTF